ncbi:MAG: asparagine synthase-related protein [Pseudomonadota bacterium]
MSGICGIVRPNNQTVEQAEIERMLEPLARRGPDGSRTVMAGSVGLGHASLATTPEALVEQLPLTDGASGCTITADARLDNRGDLLTQLGLADATRTIGDGELILLAYLQWGKECLDHLRGDFAFAIWDARSEELFCARDQVGMRQLIYAHKPGELFAFATEPHALLRHPDIPAEVNEARIADFLEGFEARDLTSTFFTGLHRLPPAHALVLNGEELRIWRYWQLKAPPMLHLPDDDAYADAFLEVFTEAVRARLRSSTPVGSMLSGGMDSGSVSAVAARLLKESDQAPLRTYSAIRDDPECVESRTIRSALAIDHIEPLFVSLEEFEKFRADLERLTRECAEPFDSHMTLLRAVYLRAHRDGVKVMLDGVGGDTTLASEEMIRRYLDQGLFLQAWREVAGERRFWGPEAGSWKVFLKGLARAFAPEALLKRRRSRPKQQRSENTEQDSPITPEFAERIDIQALREQNAAHIAKPSDPDARKAKRALHPYVVVARERYDRTASALAIEPRDPFLDIRVLEFCLSLPQEQLQKDGWPKIVLRRAMGGILPDAVRWRVGKEHLGWEFTKALWSDGPNIGDHPKNGDVSAYLKSGRPDRGSNRNDEDWLEAALVGRHLADWWTTLGSISDPRSALAENSEQGSL